jgi:hypothetical protein
MGILSDTVNESKKNCGCGKDPCETYGKKTDESYSPGDEMEDGMVSNCCGAPIMDVYDGHGRCSDCKEMASAEKEEAYYETAEIQRLKDLIRY